MTISRDPLLRTMTVLTVLSGIADAISYLGIGHVFTANMTGNIVLLGFAAAGWPGFSALASLVSLAGFLVGAAAAGRLAVDHGDRRLWLLGALTVESLMAAVCAVIAFARGSIDGGDMKFLVIGLLAFAMGARNSTVRRLAVPDMTTTVLTMTLTGLAADSSFAKGSNPHAGRRIVAVVCMVVGAYVGAVMMRHLNAGWPLLLWAGLAAATGVYYALVSKRELAAKAEAQPQ
ncbi:MAG TPA: YoaK family protein [Actinocrinis sp.]|nr:YoaK family protein [Actinocrinis sp.]